MTKTKYENYTHAQLLEEVKRLSKQKKYGLVWEEEKTKEQFEEEGKLPVLVEDKKRAIKTDADKPTHILIEGDNYHALSVLNYTHAKSIDVIYIDPPYNTGAKDWKYNNDFVVSEDAYKHSKWLSMMKKRLVLSKKLLKKDGVLIVAIDENEMCRLGLLLEDIFNGFEIHCITIVHNPRGVQGKNFSYTHEYAFFCFPKGKQLIGTIKREEKLEEELRDHGGESLRTDARNCFYPILVKNEKIVGFGDIPDSNFHPIKKNTELNDLIEVWPLDMKGIERKWVFAKNTVESIKDKLFVRKKKNGEVDIYRIKDTQKPRTVWTGKDYDASTYGSKIVNTLTGTTFPFPKSIFNVKDCLECIIKQKKDAIILDYFSGSGTTGHAVSLINKEDDGSRQFILCTNNENGIAQEVCYPRIKAVIKGHSSLPELTDIPSNLKYYKTNFVSSEPTHRNKKLLTTKSVEMLCIKENTFVEVLNKAPIYIFKSKEKYTAILLDELKLTEFKKEIKKLKLPVSVYVFSLEGDDFSEEFEGFKNNITFCSIPEAILKVYRRIYETAKLIK